MKNYQQKFPQMKHIMVHRYIQLFKIYSFQYSIYEMPSKNYQKSLPQSTHETTSHLLHFVMQCFST